VTDDRPRHKNGYDIGEIAWAAENDFSWWTNTAYLIRCGIYSLLAQ